MRLGFRKNPLPPAHCEADVEPQLYMYYYILNGFVWRPCAELSGKLALVRTITRRSSREAGRLG